MKEIKERELLIISVFLKQLKPAQNKVKHKKFIDILKYDLDIDYILSKSYTNTVPADSVIVLIDSKHELELIKSIAFERFKVESLIHQNMYGSACLMYANGNKEYPGIYQEISQNETAYFDKYYKTLDNIFHYA